MGVRTSLAARASWGFRACSENTAQGCETIRYRLAELSRLVARTVVSAKLSCCQEESVVCFSVPKADLQHQRFNPKRLSTDQ